MEPSVCKGRNERDRERAKDTAREKWKRWRERERETTRKGKATVGCRRSVRSVLNNGK